MGMRKLHSHTKDFEQFYEEHFNRVYTFFARKVRHTEEAKDLVQDVFIKVFQNWHKIQQAEREDAYLFTIARNTLIDYFRSILQMEQLENLPPFAEMIETGSSNEAYSDEQIQLLHQTIESLPEQRRQIIKLKKLRGLSTEEIARELSISNRTVENQVYRAMATLRKHMANFFSFFL